VEALLFGRRPPWYIHLMFIHPHSSFRFISSTLDSSGDRRSFCFGFMKTFKRITAFTSF
jgi:hypothetical protein